MSSPFGSSSSSHLCFSSANRQVQRGEACCQATAQSVWLKLWFPIYHLRDWCGSFPLMLCRAAGMDSCTAAPHLPNESLLWNETFGSHGVGLAHLQPTWHLHLHLQNVILYLRPNLCPPNWVHFGTSGGICFFLLHIWLFKIILTLRSFVHCAMTPDKSNCGEGTRQIKGCTKTSFTSALLNDNGHTDGGVTTRFHHYDWF